MLLPYIGTSGQWSDPVGARRRQAKALHRRTAWNDFLLHSYDVTHMQEPPIYEWSHIRKRISSHWWKFHAALMKESSMKVSIHAFSYERVMSREIYKFTYVRINIGICQSFFICVACLFNTCHMSRLPMAPPDVLNADARRCMSYLCAIQLVHMCDTTRSYVRHNSFISVPWVINQFVWYVSFMNGSFRYSESRCSNLCVSLIWVSLVCNTRCSYVW